MAKSAKRSPKQDLMAIADWVEAIAIAFENPYFDEKLNLRFRFGKGSTQRSINPAKTCPRPRCLDTDLKNLLRLQRQAHEGIQSVIERL